MILVTGATGNVGLATVQILAQAGHAVVAGLRDPTDTQQLEPGIPVVAFDFTAPASYAPALRGVDALLLVRPPAISQVKTFINPVVDAAKAAGVGRIVLLSLLGAERMPWVPHRAIETHIEAAGVPYTFLRPSFFMQNLSTTHRDEIRLRNEIAVPAGQGRTSFIDVRDIAAVAVKVLTEDGHAGRGYPLTGGSALSYTEVAAIFTAVLGRPIVYSNPSIPRFVWQLRRRGLAWGLIFVMVGIYTTARLGLAAQVTEDLPRLLGRAPRTMRQFVEEQRAVWQ
jgi:uncharacterized protein YbjT (DUF2867 family)